VRKIRDAGCAVGIVHARKAVLGGLSPKDNREIPPLRYDVVRRVKEAFPDLTIVVNGGLKDSASVHDALHWIDGVMLGREAYHRPFVLSEIEDVNAQRTPAQHASPTLPRLIAPAPGANSDPRSRLRMAERMADYAERRMREGDRLSVITRHMLGLYSGQPGAREFRRMLSEGSREPGAAPELILRAAASAEAARR